MFISKQSVDLLRVQLLNLKRIRIFLGARMISIPDQEMGAYFRAKIRVLIMRIGDIDE